MKKNKKIVIVEDEKILLEAIARKLEIAGYEVSTAENGEEGMEKIKQVHPDLILLDIQMPKMNGMEVLEALQADSALAQIPVVIISNSGQPVEIEKAVSLGVKDYLIKAEFDPEEVLDKVNKVLMIDESLLASQGEVKKKIMIVEDDQLLRDLCSRKMVAEGFAVEAVMDGAECLSRLEKSQPDIILLDIILPGMNGFDVLAGIKSHANKAISSVPVLILSNLGQESDMKKGEDLGAVDYLIKATTTTSEIAERVKKILNIS